MKTRSATQIIWKTVVFAGAMLAVPACGGAAKSPDTMPDNTATGGAGGTEAGTESGSDDTEQATPTESQAAEDPCAGGEVDPCANPCGERFDGEEGGVGRGFVLS